MNKLILSLAMAFWAVGAQAQVVNIPDPKFLKALIRSGIDTNNDEQIQTSEVQDVTDLHFFSSDSINDLTGIEAFTSLSLLHCSYNQLKKIDVSKNLALTNLWCDNNYLTSLDVSKNSNLTELDCYTNQITTLDLSSNISLVNLYCGENEFVSLDVSKNTALNIFSCNATPNLTQICISTAQLNKINTTPNNWHKDSTATWSTTCVTGIEDELLQSATQKTLVKIVTPLGQAIKPEQVTDGLYIYQYSDGSTRKVMKQ